MRRLLLAVTLACGGSLAPASAALAADVLTTCPHYEPDGPDPDEYPDLISETVYESSWMTVWGHNGARNEADALCVGFLTFTKSALVEVDLTNPVASTIDSVSIFAQWSRGVGVDDRSGYAVQIVGSAGQALTEWLTIAALGAAATPGGVIVEAPLTLTPAGNDDAAWVDARIRIAGNYVKVGKPDNAFFGLFRHHLVIA